MLSQGAARKLGNSRVWQLLAQGKGSAGSGLPGGPPGRLAGRCCHGAHHGPDLSGTVVGPGGGLRAMGAHCPHSLPKWQVDSGTGGGQSPVGWWTLITGHLICKSVGNHTPSGTPQAGTRVPCEVAWKEHQQPPPPVSLSLLVPLGRVRLDHIQVLTQIPFFLGAPQDLPEPGGCCPPPLPKSRTNFAMSASHRDAAGEVKETRGVESIVRMWKKFPQSGGPGLRTEVPQRKGPPTCFPCPGSTPLCLQTPLGTTGPISSSTVLARRCVVTDCGRDRC